MEPDKDDKRIWGEVLAIVGAAVICILILSAIMVGLKYFRDFDPQAAKVDELIRNARAGDWERAYLCMDEDFKNKVTIEKMRETLNGQPGFQAGGTHELQSFNYTSTRAGTVDVKLKSMDDRETTMRFVLYLPVTGFNFLVTDVEIERHSLFESQLRPKP